jgi:hypothetical protein
MKAWLVLVSMFLHMVTPESKATTPSPLTLEMWNGMCERELERRETGQHGNSDCTMYLLGAFNGTGQTDTCGLVSIRSLPRAYLAFARTYDQTNPMSQAKRDFVISTCSADD